jgi:hypothetical protein
MWHGSVTETLSAEPVGPAQYRLDNVPFFAFNVSLRDVVVARQDGDALVFVEVILRGGHSTYRIKPTGDPSDVEKHWQVLGSLGCTYEAGPRGLRAVDVPPAVNIFEAYAALETGEKARAWEFEEGHCGHATA